MLAWDASQTADLPDATGTARMLIPTLIAVMDSLLRGEVLAVGSRDVQRGDNLRILRQLPGLQAEAAEQVDAAIRHAVKPVS